MISFVFKLCRLGVRHLRMLWTISLQYVYLLILVCYNEEFIVEKLIVVTELCCHKIKMNTKEKHIIRTMGFQNFITLSKAIGSLGCRRNSSSGSVSIRQLTEVQLMTWCCPKVTFTRPVIMSLVHCVSTVTKHGKLSYKSQKRDWPCILHGHSKSQRVWGNIWIVRWANFIEYTDHAFDAETVVD